VWELKGGKGKPTGFRKGESGEKTTSAPNKREKRERPDYSLLLSEKRGGLSVIAGEERLIESEKRRSAKPTRN